MWIFSWSCNCEFIYLSFEIRVDLKELTLSDFTAFVGEYNAKWKGPVSDSGSLAGSAEDDNRLRGFRLQAQLLE